MKSDMSYPPLTQSGRQTWVQTERASHEAWGRLTIQSPRAAALMHHLVAHMDQHAAVVASHATLAHISGLSPATVKRAVKDLKDGNWIQVVQLGGKGGALAFIVNSRVGWSASREMLPMAAFTARVLAIRSEQEATALSGPELRRLPILRYGDRQLPSGLGETPPAQPSIDGLEPDLPNIVTPSDIEAHGQVRLDVDPQTGEIRPLRGSSHKDAKR